MNKTTAAVVATSLGLAVRDFHNKKTGKDDPKKVVLKADRSDSGNVALAAFRKLTGMKPIVVKRGSNRLIAVFSRAMLNSKKVQLPTIKLG